MRVDRRAWSGLKYMNPTRLLLAMDKLFDESGLKRYRHASDILLDRRIRQMGEDRRCAIFCHGAGQALGTTILFSAHESADYDYVGAYQRDGSIYRFPIQLKQLVPDRINSSTSLSRELEKLLKYADADDLVVALHVNRLVHFNSSDLDTSRIKVKEIWLYGKLDGAGDEWLLLGNLKNDSPQAYRFRLPYA